MKADDYGQSLIEVLMIITLLSITSVIAISVISDTLNESRFEDTKVKLIAIRKGLMGDPTLVQSAERASYGYLGDVGALPTASIGIAGLWGSTPTGITAFSMNSTANYGIGWNGPYLNELNSNLDYTIDGWGNAFVYSPAATPPTVTSYGADGAAGGTGFNADISIEIPTTTAKIYGVIIKNGAKWSSSATILLYKASGTGTLSQAITAVAPAANGAFTFSNVPLGYRSLKIYVPNELSPTEILGPVGFSVSSANYVIPSTLLDLAH